MVSDNNRVYKVLIVDDEPIFLHNTAEILRKAGYDVGLARNGNQALKELDNSEYSLVLLDVVMPGMNGIDTINRMKSMPKIKEIPVIIISTMTEYRDRVEFFSIGANDYMPKPIDQGELVARVKTQIDLLELKESLKYTNLELMNKNQRLDNYINRVEKEIAIARKFQRSMLPDNYHSVNETELYYKMLPLEHLSSDFVDYWSDDDRIVICIADVVGHGITSALIAAQLKMMFRIFTREYSLIDAVEMINRDVSSVLADNYYLTACFYDLNICSGEYSCVSAGHVPIIIYEDREKYSLIHSSSAPIGIDTEAKYELVSGKVTKDFIVIMTTDGIIEVTQDEVQYGINRVAEDVMVNWNMGLEDCIDNIIRSARLYSDIPVFKDDVTICAISSKSYRK